MTIRAQIFQARLEFRLLMFDIECFLINAFWRFQEFNGLTKPDKFQKIDDFRRPKICKATPEFRCQER